MLDPNQLRVFLVAAETLNFSRAAERLHMSQPSVTQHIQLLEAHFNAPLFHRNGRRLSLSSTGRALIPLAHRLVSLVMQTDEIMNAIQKQIHGELTIACSTTPGKYILPVLLAGFLQKYPLVKVRCEIHPRAAALGLLEQGKAHVAFSNSIEEFNQNIEFQKFITDPVQLVCPLEHPWAQKGEIQPGDLLKERFVLREESTGTYRAARAGLAKIGINIHDLNTVLTLGNSESVAIAIQQGIGVGFISQTVIDYIMAGRIAQVNAPGLNIQQDIYLCRHRLHPFSELQNAFWDFVSQSIYPS